MVPSGHPSSEARPGKGHHAQERPWIGFRPDLHCTPQWVTAANVLGLSALRLQGQKRRRRKGKDGEGGGEGDEGRERQEDDMDVDEPGSSGGRKHEAAVKIQARFRGYVVRKAYIAYR